MLSTAPLTTPYTPTNSDRRERQMLAEWRLERDAARRAGLYRARRSASPACACGSHGDRHDRPGHAPPTRSA